MLKLIIIGLFLMVSFPSFGMNSEEDLSPRMEEDQSHYMIAKMRREEKQNYEDLHRRMTLRSDLDIIFPNFQNINEIINVLKQEYMKIIEQKKLT